LPSQRTILGRKVYLIVASEYILGMKRRKTEKFVRFVFLQGARSSSDE